MYQYDQINNLNKRYNRFIKTHEFTKKKVLSEFEKHHLVSHGKKTTTIVWMHIEVW